MVDWIRTRDQNPSTLHNKHNTRQIPKENIQNRNCVKIETDPQSDSTNLDRNNIT